MGIYVEIFIRAPMQALWSHTQTPDLHERWDLRFSRIDYLPKAAGSPAQRFRYTTRLGFGFEVRGEGETVGHRDHEDGGATSALKFGSAQAHSLIQDGSGYWKYVPADGGVRFLTWYDYRTRFGALGAGFDRWVFRPLIGWATAWSFDRLRLWLEEGVTPEQALRQSTVHAIARITLAVVFAYHGLVPKLLARNADEMAMIRDAGIAAGPAGVLVTVLGVLELAFAAMLLLAWRQRWPLFACIAAMLFATVGVGLSSPRYLVAAFDPFTLDLAVVALAVIDLLALGSVPSAGRCLRRPRVEAA
jgi:hypothetical protein